MSDHTDQIALREAELDLAEARVNDLHTRFRTTGLDEKSTLAGWFDYHRAVLLRKCAGLTDEQAHRGGAAVDAAPAGTPAAHGRQRDLVVPRAPRR